jgi:hypothetical protein
LSAAVSRSTYDFIYISKILRGDNCRPLDIPRTFPYFLEHLRLDDAFEAVYETNEVLIYKRR